MNNVAELIARERKAARLTQAELAQKAGVSLRFIIHLEQGKPTLRMDTVNKVLFLFDRVLGPHPLQREP